MIYVNFQSPEKKNSTGQQISSSSIIPLFFKLANCKANILPTLANVSYFSLPI